MNVPSGYEFLNLIGFTDKGTYNESTVYARNDLAHYGPCIWRCLIDDTTGIEPTTENATNWSLWIDYSSSAENISYDPTGSGASGETVQAVLDEILNDMSHCEMKTATLAASGWSSSAPYTQTVTVSGITAEDTPIIKAVIPEGSSAASEKAIKKAASMLSYADTAADSITFTCIAKKPAVDFDVTIKPLV